MSPSLQSGGDVVVIGAGIAGLAAAARLAHLGLGVTVLERHASPGGKIRTLASVAGPVDAGPTVLTMRGVFDELFAALDERLGDHLTLVRQKIIARHFWPDGSQLDLHDTEDDTLPAIRAFAGHRGAEEFQSFNRRARQLFETFEQPIMQAERPRIGAVALRLLRTPLLLQAMAPFSTLAEQLDHGFEDARLAQLFGRYATYVGGSPYRSPALLALIWHAEAAGVWAVDGGMHRLAQVLADLATARGATIRYGAHVERIGVRDGTVTEVTLASGERVAARSVLFNGDPRALAMGALGPGCAGVAPQTTRRPRSLSAEVWAFAATAHGPDLGHHNLFFRDDPAAEFTALARGSYDPSPTLYVCAMDRGFARPAPEIERFEIIANAPPTDGTGPADEAPSCRHRTFQTLARFGLTFDPTPRPEALTPPPGFDRLFPHSAGSLYGQSPHGLLAAFQRPTARTAIRGLYLAGGGTHPGAGLPMATLSARHAAAAIMQDRTSTSPSRRTATPGGMSTGSATTADARSASSGS